MSEANHGENEFKHGLEGENMRTVLDALKDLATAKEADASACETVVEALHVICTKMGGTPVSKTVAAAIDEITAEIGD